MRRVAITTCAAAAWLAGAIPVHADVLGTIPVPGGSAAFRCATGLPDTLPRARLVLGVSHHVATVPAPDPMLDGVAAYVSWLETLQKRIDDAKAAEGFSISAAPPKAARTLAEFLGLRTRTRKGTLSVSYDLRQKPAAADKFATCLGINLPDSARQLSGGGTVRLMPPADAVPFPGSPAQLGAILRQERLVTHPFAALLTNRDALLAYEGLSSVDAETADFFLSRPALFRHLVDDQPRAFALFASAIRVRGGAVDVPGGPALDAAWEAFIRRPPSDAEAFIRRVLTEDEGRLAEFYAAMDSTDPAIADVAFRDAQGRLSQPVADRLYDVFRNYRPGWNETDPAHPPPFSPALALRGLEAASDHRLRGPLNARFWEIVWNRDDLPERSERLLKADRPEQATLADLFETIFQEPADARARFELVRYGQRMFPTDRDARAEVLVAILAFKWFPALMLDLERMGIRDATVLATVARAASRFKVDGLDHAVSLRQWQGALALIEALRRTGAIDVKDSSDAIMSLASLVSPGGLPRGKVLEWIDRELSELVFRQNTEAPRRQSLERAILSLSSGPVGGSGARLEWEGLTYQSDVAAAQVARALNIAASQPRPSLDDLTALLHASVALEGAKTAKAVATIAADLRARIPRFKWPQPGADGLTAVKPEQPGRILTRVLRDLERIRRDQDVKRARKASEPLLDLADALLADVLPALVYAGRLSAGIGPPAQYADLWRRHDFGFVSTQKVNGPHPWRPPLVGEASAGRSLHVAGSLLGVDLALGRSLLRRVPREALPVPAETPDLLALPIWQAVAASATASTIADSASVLAEIAPALQRGRQRFRDHVMRDEGVRSLTPLRWNLARWTAKHDPQPVDTEVSLTELVVLGLNGVPPAELHALGVAAPALDGCWCMRFPTVYELRAGEAGLRSGSGDISLRVAAFLSDLNAPADLLPSVLATAAVDVLEDLRPWSPDDWLAVTRAVGALPRDRLEQYVFALLSSRELVVKRAGTDPR